MPRALDVRDALAVGVGGQVVDRREVEEVLDLAVELVQVLVADAEPVLAEIADDGNDPLASPLHAEDLSGLPPAIVVTAEFDPLRDDGDAYAEALQKAGVKVIHRRFDGLVHGFFGLGPFSSKSRDAIEQVCADLRELLGC